MQIVNAFGERCGASQVRVEMVKTLIVKVYLDVRGLPGNEVSEEEIEEMAHEDWLEIQARTLATASAQFPYIDIEFLSTDHVRVEVIE